jgi:hypothetical protein
LVVTCTEIPSIWLLPWSRSSRRDINTVEERLHRHIVRITCEWESGKTARGPWCSAAIEICATAVRLKQATRSRLNACRQADAATTRRMRRAVAVCVHVLITPGQQARLPRSNNPAQMVRSRRGSRRLVGVRRLRL